MQAVSASTTLFEMTTLHEGAAAVRRRCAQQRVKVALGRWTSIGSGSSGVLHPE